MMEWSVHPTEHLLFSLRNFYSFSPLFVSTVSQKLHEQSCWNLSQSFPIMRNQNSPLVIMITHPWRRPGAILYFFRHICKLWLCNNGRSFYNQILQTLTSGQGSTFAPKPIRARVMTYAYARVKILKCSKWLHFKSTIRFRPLWAF